MLQHRPREIRSHPDETSALLLGRNSTMDNVENGYGASDRKSESTFAISSCSSTANESDERVVKTSPDDGEGDEDGGSCASSWLLPFFVNIFLSCASFSIVMPTLPSYMLDMKAPLAFLPWVVSSYSLGEMLGSLLIGMFYEHATKNFKTVGSGPRVSMMLCIGMGVVGSFMYSLAGWVENGNAAKYCLLGARLVQGLWTGGQQAVEQAYLSASVHQAERTEYTATLSTCAVLGFVLGPTLGALLSQIDTNIPFVGLSLNANNAPGIFMLVATSVMFVQTALFFDGKNDIVWKSNGDVNKCDNQNLTADFSQRSKPVNTYGVATCLIVFYVHYYSFAVQETVIVPLVIILYDWGPLEINLLFIGSGMMSLLTAFCMQYLARYAEDRTMLLCSIMNGFVGSLLLVDLPFSQSLPTWRFLAGFFLTTVAFPLGRNAVLGIFGNVLGDTNQGRWMGLIFAISAFPRVIGPFISLELLIAKNWQTWLEFGICAVLFGMTALATSRHLEELVPYDVYFRDRRNKGHSNQTNQPSS